MAIVALAPVPSAAHGIATSKQAVVGQYIIEFEYEAFEQVPSQEPVGYTIRLIDQKSNADVPFDYAFVRVQKDNRTVFNSHVAQAPDTVGIGRFAMALPDPGRYSATLSFMKQGKTLAETSFEYASVSTRNESAPNGGLDLKNLRQIALMLTMAGIGLVIGLLISSLFERKNKNKE